MPKRLAPLVESRDFFAEVSMRVVLVALLLVSSLAVAQELPYTVRASAWTQAWTADAPNTSTVGCAGAPGLSVLAIQGMSLDSVKGFHVLAHPGVYDSGESLSAGGFLRAWLYDYRVGIWSRNPSLDLTVAVGGRSVVWPDQSVLVPTGCVYYQADGLFGSGSNVTIRVVAWVGTRGY